VSTSPQQKVVQQSGVLNRAAGRHQVAQCLVNRQHCHRMGILCTVQRIYAVRQDGATPGLGAGLEHRGIRRPGATHQWFPHRAALNLVVVTADHLFLAGDIWMSQQS